MANRKVAPLTDTNIKNAKSKEKDYLLPDGNGLYLNIKMIGTKVWTIRYTINGKAKKTTFGNYPAISLLNARKRRDEELERVAQGIDPVANKKDKKKADELLAKDSQSTFKNIAAEWLSRKQSEICETHYKKTIRYLQKDIYPVIGDKHIDGVTRADILQIIKKLDDNGAGVAARKCLSITRMVYKYALTFSKANHNIAADIDTTTALRKREPQNFAFIKDPKELGELLRAIDAYQGDISTKYALKLMPLVFVRPANIRFMEWSEIDFKKAVWNIPAEKMKMKDPHIVPLSTQAIEILREVQKYNGSYRYVFASQVTTVRPLSENTLNIGLKRLGFGDRIVSHGFRHTASTLLNTNKKASGFDSDVIERQLAHKERNKIKAVYDHAEYLEERKELMQWWSNYIDELKQS
jgi:integrase